MSQLSAVKTIEVRAGGASATLGLDGPGMETQTQIGTCGDPLLITQNPIWDVAPGESREVRMRLELPPSTAVGICTSCTSAYVGAGISNARCNTHVEDQSGAFEPLFAGTFSVTLHGSHDDSDTIYDWHTSAGVAVTPAN